MDALHVQLVTQESIKFEGQARQVQLPGVVGEMGILPSHAPLVTMLAPGKIRVMTREGTQSFAVAEGFAKVENNQVVCLVDAAVSQAEVDPAKVSARIPVLEQEIASNPSERARNELKYLRAQQEL